MTKKVVTRENWYAANPFFGNKDAYDSFAEEMLQSADEGELPMCFEHSEPETLTIQDIMTFSRMFQQDTGLAIEFRLMTCEHCDRLHCLIIVDESEENREESDKYVWQ